MNQNTLGSALVIVSILAAALTATIDPIAGGADWGVVIATALVAALSVYLQFAGVPPGTTARFEMVALGDGGSWGRVLTLVATLLLLYAAVAFLIAILRLWGLLDCCL